MRPVQFSAQLWQGARSRRSILTDLCCNANSGPVRARSIASTPKALFGAGRSEKIQGVQDVRQPAARRLRCRSSPTFATPGKIAGVACANCQQALSGNAQLGAANPFREPPYSLTGIQISSPPLPVLESN